MLLAQLLLLGYSNRFRLTSTCVFVCMSVCLFVCLHIPSPCGIVNVIERDLHYYILPVVCISMLESVRVDVWSDGAKVEATVQVRGGSRNSRKVGGGGGRVLKKAGP